MMFGHGGYGGQNGFADTKYKIGFGYGTNHMNPFVNNVKGDKGDNRAWNLQEALFQCVYKLENVSVERKAFKKYSELQAHEDSKK